MFWPTFLAVLSVTALTGSRPAKHQVDLAEDPRYQEKLAEMEALLLSEQRRLDDPYRLWNQPDDGLSKPQEAPPKGKKVKRKPKRAVPR